jgi:hypothetical protein
MAARLVDEEHDEEKGLFHNVTSLTFTARDISTCPELDCSLIFADEQYE